MLYVLDKSSTMNDANGLKSRSVRSAMLIQDLSQIGMKYKVVAFDGKVETNHTPSWVGFPELNQSLVNMDLGGFGTAISSALSAASSVVKFDEGQKPTAVIFISDGVPSVSKDSCFYSNGTIMSSNRPGGLGDNPNGPRSNTTTDGFFDRSIRANANPVTRCDGYSGSQKEKCNYCVKSKPTYGSAIQEVLDQVKLFTDRSKVYLYSIGVLEDPWNEPVMKQIGVNGYFSYGKGTNGNVSVSQALNSAFETAFEKMCGFKRQSTMTSADWAQYDKLMNFCDLDKSGVCDTEDYQLALDNFGQSTKSISRSKIQVTGDLNGDRVFNASDISKWQEIINATTLPL